MVGAVLLVVLRVEKKGVGQAWAKKGTSQELQNRLEAFKKVWLENVMHGPIKPGAI